MMIKNIDLDNITTMVMISCEYSLKDKRYIFAYDLACELLDFHKVGIKNVFVEEKEEAFHIGLNYIIKSILENLSEYIWSLNSYKESYNFNLNGKIGVILESILLSPFQEAYSNAFKSWIEEDLSRSYLNVEFSLYESDISLSSDDIFDNICDIENIGSLVDGGLMICHNMDFIKIYQEMYNEKIAIFKSCIDVASQCYEESFCKNCQLDCLCKYYILNVLTEEQANEIEEINKSNMISSIYYKQNKTNLVN